MNLTSGDGSGERIKSLGVHKLEETTRPKHMKRKLLALYIEYIRVLVCPWSKKEQLSLFQSHTHTQAAQTSVQVEERLEEPLRSPLKVTLH